MEERLNITATGRRPLRSGWIPLTDKDLERLSDEELVRYVAAARLRQHYVEGARALALLCWGWRPRVELALARKLPLDAVESVADKVIASAGKHALEGRIDFKGTSVGEFVEFMAKVIARRISDYYRNPRTALVRERLAEDVEDGQPGVQIVARDETEAVADRLLVEEVLESLSPLHRAAARLSELDGVPAKEVARMVPGMTPVNVYKNAERFRARLRAAAQAADALSHS
jgi:RNA polymerase sigma factor (sigma-70 family)